MNASLSKFIWRKSFDVSEWTEGESHMIVLREPNTAEFKQLVKIQKKLTSEDDGESVVDVLETFTELCKTIIVDHDFYEDDNTAKLSSKDLAEFISCRLEFAQALITDYMMSLPLLQKSGKA